MCKYKMYENSYSYIYALYIILYNSHAKHIECEKVQPSKIKSCLKMKE